jgi:hypothetical protein
MIHRTKKANVWADTWAEHAKKAMTCIEKNWDSLEAEIEYIRRFGLRPTEESNEERRNKRLKEVKDDCGLELCEGYSVNE